MSTSIQNGLRIGVALSAAAAISYIATINHGIASRSLPAVCAAFVVALGTIPPMFFGPVFSNGAATQLAIVAWRMGIMLPAVVIATRFGDDERKCYLIALLACYFVALSLESWLLIRDVRRKQALDS